MHSHKYVVGQAYLAPCAWLQAMRAQPAARPTAEQMHCHAWLRGPLVTTPPLARLASAEEAGAGALCVAQLAAALPPV